MWNSSQFFVGKSKKDNTSVLRKTSICLNTKQILWAKFEFNTFSQIIALLATVVEGDQKASFSIATTLSCRGRALLLSLNCSTLPLWRVLYCWLLSKEVSSIIFKVFGMTQPGIERRSPGPLVNTLPTKIMCLCELLIFFEN